MAPARQRRRFPMARSAAGNAAVGLTAAAIGSDDSGAAAPALSDGAVSAGNAAVGLTAAAIGSDDSGAAAPAPADGSIPGSGVPAESARNAATSGRQVPQPVPARVAAHSSSRVALPAATAALRSSAPTPWHEHTRRPRGLPGSPAAAGRRSCSRCSSSSEPVSMSRRNAANSALSPISTAPTKRSWRTTHFL